MECEREMIKTVSLVSSWKLVEHNNGLDLHKRFLYTVGLWPGQDEPHGPGYYLRYWLPRIQVPLALVVGTVVYPIGVYANWGDITGLSECISSTFISFNVLVKTGYPFSKSVKFQRLVQTTEEICNRRHGDTEGERRIRKNTQKLTNMTIAYNISCFVMAFAYSWGLFPYLLLTRQFYVGGWYPYDEYASPYFEISLPVLAFCICSLYVLAFVDTLFIAIVIQLIGQLKLLRHNLIRIRLSSIETIDAKKLNDVTGEAFLKHISELDTVERYKCNSVETSLGESYTPFEVLAVRIEQNVAMCPDCSQQKHDGKRDQQRCVPEEVLTTKTEQIAAMCPNCSHRMQDKISERNQELDKEMKRRLADCIKHHQELCSFKDDIEATFFEILIYQILFCLLSTVSMVIWSTMVETVIDVRVMGFVAITCLSMLEWFVFCYLGNKIREQDTKVREAVYGIDWYEASSGFKKDMRIIMSKCNQPIVINVANFIPLSMDTYFSVVHLIYSYYMAVRSSISAHQH